MAGRGRAPARRGPIGAPRSEALASPRSPPLAALTPVAGTSFLLWIPPASLVLRVRTLLLAWPAASMLPSTVFTETMGRLKATEAAADIATAPTSCNAEGAGGGISKTVADAIFVGDGTADAVNGAAVWNSAGTVVATGDVV